ncbi:MAG: calcium-binding protein, partial [Planctomycetes bacterium]|nr:calcium-binding protein [Planctomycetota bacterium]
MDLLDGLSVRTRPGNEFNLTAGFHGSGGIDIHTPAFCTPKVDMPWPIPDIPKVCFPRVDIFVLDASVAADVSIGMDVKDPNNDGKLRFDEIRWITDRDRDLSTYDFRLDRVPNLFDINASFSGAFNISGEILDVGISISDLGVPTRIDLGLSLQGILGAIDAVSTPPPLLGEILDGEDGKVLRINAGVYDDARVYGDVDDSNGANIVVTGDGGTIRVRFGGDHQDFNPVGITRIVAVGDDGNDTFDFSGYNGDAQVEVHGGAGNDTLTGSAGNDLIYGGSGNDHLDGRGGDDRVFGELGNDVIVGGAGNDVLTGGLGNDTLDGGAGDDTYLFDSDWGADTIAEVADGGDDTVNLAAALNTLLVTLRPTQASITDLTSTISHAACEIENLLGGRGDDVYAVYGTGPRLITLNGQMGSDQYLLYSEGGQAANVSVQDIGCCSNSDQLVLFGSAGSDTYRITATAAYRDPANPDDRIVYDGARSGLEFLTVLLGGGDDVFNVQSTPATMAVTLSGEQGADTNGTSLSGPLSSPGGTGGFQSGVVFPFPSDGARFLAIGAVRYDSGGNRVQHGIVNRRQFPCRRCPQQRRERQNRTQRASEAQAYRI